MLKYGESGTSTTVFGSVLHKTMLLFLPAALLLDHLFPEWPTMVMTTRFICGDRDVHSPGENIHDLLPAHTTICIAPATCVHNTADSWLTSFSILLLGIGLEAQMLCFGHIFGLVPLLKIMKWKVSLLALNVHQSFGNGIIIVKSHDPC